MLEWLLAAAILIAVTAILPRILIRANGTGAQAEDRAS